MDLKNALAVCLISLVSATLVVLIARALDHQAAARLEPQLVRIVEELEAIRKAGGVRPAGSAAGAEGTAGASGELEFTADGLIVYYFHSSTRCPTCRAIESQSRDVVRNEFAEPLASGRMAWKMLNYEDPSVAELAREFDVQVPVVVVARTQGGQITEFDRLDQVWNLWDDPPAFSKYVEGAIRKMQSAPQPQPEPQPAPPKETASPVAVPANAGDMPLP